MKEHLKKPNIEINEESFGIIHGDLHIGNYMMTKTNNDYELCFIDWEGAIKSWFMIDLGTMIFTAYSILIKELSLFFSHQKALELTTQYTNWIC